MEQDKIIYIGDIHGEFPRLWYLIRNKDIKNAILIQVGDFGVGFNKPNYYKDTFQRLNKVLVERNCILYAIRGNHDDPSWFEETNHPFDYSNIILLKDYEEKEFLGKTHLFLGGAVSVDRKHRVEGKSWWNNEGFVLAETFPARDYDVVVSHTRPSICGHYKGFGNIGYWTKNDESLISDLKTEAKKMNKIWEKTRPKNWIYGHFHESLDELVEGTHFRCLNIDEMWINQS